MLQALLFKQNNFFPADTGKLFSSVIETIYELDVFYKLLINKIYICMNPTIGIDYTKYTTFSIVKNNKYGTNIC